MKEKLYHCRFSIPSCSSAHVHQTKLLMYWSHVPFYSRFTYSWAGLQLVLDPRPRPQGGKRSGIHQTLSWACFWILTHQSDSCHVTFMWSSRYSQLLLCVRAIDVLPYPNDVLSWQSHDMLHPVHTKNVRCIPDLSLLEGGVWEWE